MIAKAPNPQPKPIKCDIGPSLLATLIATLSLGVVFALCSWPVKKTVDATAAEQPKAETPPVEAKTETPPPQVRAIVLCCSDPRFDMIDRIRERYNLKKGEAFPIVVPGGPDPLANPELMEWKCRSEKEDVNIILDPKHHFPFLKIVIVAEHEDCACIKHYGFTDPHHGKKDFPAIREFFSARAPDLKLEMLYYSFKDREKGLVNPDPEVVEID